MMSLSSPAYAKDKENIMSIARKGFICISFSYYLNYGAGVVETQDTVSDKDSGG